MNVMQRVPVLAPEQIISGLRDLRFKQYGRVTTLLLFPFEAVSMMKEKLVFLTSCQVSVRIRAC